MRKPKANFLPHSPVAFDPGRALFVKLLSSLAFSLPSHSPFLPPHLPPPTPLAGFLFCPFPKLTFWAG